MIYSLIQSFTNSVIIFNMKKIYLALSFLILSNIIIAQNPNGCNGLRYTDEIFTDVDSMTVKFGENYTFGGDFQELYMDIYQPAGDTRTDRPVVIMAFGGAYIQGNRAQVKSFCEQFARKGYVSVGIDYRIYSIDIANIPDSLGMLDIIVKSIADMKASIRALRKSVDDGNPYGIDPDFIFTGGLSAGAVTALHTAQLGADDTDILPQYIIDAINANGGWEGDTDDPNNSAVGYSSDVQGVVSYLGALHRRNWIDSDDVPFISIHGTADDVVPYGHGTVTLFTLDLGTLEGSGVLHPYADQVGVTNQLISVPGGGHGTNFAQIYWDSMAVDSGRFLKKIVCGTGGGVNVDEPEDVNQYITIAPNPANEQTIIGFNNLNKKYNIFLYNNFGQLISYFNDQNNNEFRLHRNQLPAGVYFIQIDFEDTNIAPVSRRVLFR